MRGSWTQHFKLLLTDVNPGVSEDILSSESFFWIFLEYLIEELTGSWRDVIRALEFLGADVTIQLFIVLAFKRKFATKQSK